MSHNEVRSNPALQPLLGSGYGMQQFVAMCRKRPGERLYYWRRPRSTDDVVDLAMRYPDVKFELFEKDPHPVTGVKPRLLLGTGRPKEDETLLEKLTTALAKQSASLGYPVPEYPDHDDWEPVYFDDLLHAKVGSL